MNTPAISVIMPVWNNELFVFSAIDSILKQSFDNFEFIIIDDASTDKTKKILNKIQDKRIIRIENSKNEGNYKCRNKGIEIAKGKYLCVMDGDDIAHPDRLRIQYEFMEDNLSFLAAGTDIKFFTENSIAEFKRLRNPDQLRVMLLKDNICTHPSLIFRREVFFQYHLRYNENYKYAADYDLLVEVSKVGKITNIEQFLLYYRRHSLQISSHKFIEQTDFADQIRLKQLAVFSVKPSNEEENIHLKLMKGFSLEKNEIKQAKSWIRKLLNQNTKLRVYNQKYLNVFFEDMLFHSNSEEKPKQKSFIENRTCDMKRITAILTVWKRNHLEEQLISLLNQSKKPDIIWVQQTMKHVDVSETIEKYRSYIKYSYFPENKGVFGRFESVSEVETEFIFILDDDMIPGKNYVKIAWEACMRLNGIISSSGRIVSHNQVFYVGDNLKSNRSYSRKDMRVDFGTNSWFFQTQWIKYFLQIPAYSIFNGEDMHLSATCKTFRDINTYVPAQTLPDDSGNTKREYSADTFALHLQTGFQDERFELIKYLTKQGWPLLRYSEHLEKDLNSSPQISVILPVYNVSPDYLRESVESVLSQTLTNFELLIVDDGSTDGCTDILSKFPDERIRLIKNHHNFIDTLNRGLKEAKGKYIARMDADDIMFPNRLQTQYDFMECHPEVDICGSWAEQFGSGSGIMQVPTGHDSIISSLISGNRMIHPSIIMRRESLEEVQYSDDYPCAEDYKLWTELALKGFRFANIPEMLLKYRISETQVTQNHWPKMSESSKKIQLEYVEQAMEQMVKENESYETALNPLIDLTNEGLISWESLKQIVSRIYLDFLEKDA